MRYRLVAAIAFIGLLATFSGVDSATAERAGTGIAYLAGEGDGGFEWG